MLTFPRIRLGSLMVSLVVALALIALCASAARGQAGGIGARGSGVAPSAPAPTTTPAATTPVLPSTLKLPPEATSSLVRGLDASGTALRPGNGWVVRDLTHQGINGQELSDVIHQLKPHRERGRLSFSQEKAPTTKATATSPAQQPSELPRFEDRRYGNGPGQDRGPFRGRGFGKGKGRR
jgi:hypothetical protein